MSPGTVLDGRYRLEVLMAEHGGARFWRATDTVLARSVAVHVVASDDPRAGGVLEAARASAAVSDPHLLRVLDCADVDGVTWVINEWGDGASLDVMLARGTLPAMRAAWLTREVAEAMVSAHAKGLAHGRLNPEAVLVTGSGAVKLIGFVVNAAFDQGPVTNSRYGNLGPRETDVVDLAGILYAALTGRWPGITPSSVPSAPWDGNRPLRPRQVRAGVPRTLDAICDRVLHKEASAHSLPIETALEIAAALSDFVGDPAAVAPVDVPSMHADPEETALVPVVPDAAPEVAAGSPPVDGPDPEPDPEPDPGPVPDPEPEPAASTPAAAPPGLVIPDPEPEPEPWDDPAPPAPVPEPGGRPVVDPDATMAAPPPYEPHELSFDDTGERPPAAPPPPFVKPVSRPLFADAERRVPPGAPVAEPPAAGGSGNWPFEDAPPSYAYEEPRQRRRGRKALLLLVVLALLAGAMYAAFRIGTNDDNAPGGSSPSSAPGSSLPSSSPSSTAPVTGTPVRIVAAGDFDPEGDPPEENPGRVGLAIDSDATTAWPTSRYDSADLGGIKSGVGIVVDLGSVVPITSVQTQLVGDGTSVEFYAADVGATSAPVELADAQRIGAVRDTGTTAAVTLDQRVRTRYVIVWLTRLPAVDGGFRGQIAEITVRS